MTNKKLISESDIYKFVEECYVPVEDKPGYVWLSKRNMQMISIEKLVASLIKNLRIDKYKEKSEE